MKQVVIPNPSSSESALSPAHSRLFNSMQWGSWRWFITWPVKCLLFFLKNPNIRRECKYASSPAPWPLSSSEHVWNLTRTLVHPGRLSDSGRQGCSPCVCQRRQTPKAQRDQMGNRKTGPLPSAACCHLIWVCITWEGQGGQPHLWAELSQVDGFPHLARPAGLTLPLVWPPESRWLSPSPTAHHFNFSENRTDPGREFRGTVAGGRQDRLVAMVIMGLWAAFLVAAEGGQWRPWSLHTWAVSTSGWMPCPHGDTVVILATHRMSSGFSSSFPSVTSAPLSTMVGRARQSPSQTPRGRYCDQKGWGVCPCSDGASLLLLLPPQSMSWESPPNVPFLEQKMNSEGWPETAGPPASFMSPSSCGPLISLLLGSVRDGVPSA